MEGAGETKNQRRVLIIEDDKFLRDLLVQRLGHEGFAVSAAVSGEEGIKIAFEDPPAIILLDLLLPGLNGFEVLERLKREERTAAIPVLILSNLGQPSDIERARELGADDFMVKSNFTLGEVVEKLEAILKKKYF